MTNPLTCNARALAEAVQRRGGSHADGSDDGRGASDGDGAHAAVEEDGLDGAADEGERYVGAVDDGEVIAELQRGAAELLHVKRRSQVEMGVVLCAAVVLSETVCRFWLDMCADDVPEGSPVDDHRLH